MKLDLPTPDEIRKIVREELAPLLARFDEAGIKARADLVLPGKENARRYLGFTREMWREAEELGFIQRLPFTHRGNAFLALYQAGQVGLPGLLGGLYLALVTVFLRDAVAGAVKAAGGGSGGAAGSGAGYGRTRTRG